MDTTQYLGIFIDESKEHVDVLSSQLLELEKNPDEKNGIEDIFRAAHTLKGMSATMGYTDLANLTHKMENALDAVRHETATVNTALIDLLFEAVEYLESIINDVENGGSGFKDVVSIIERLDQVEQGKVYSMKISNIETNAVPQTSLSLVESLDEFERSILTDSLSKGYANYEVTVHLIKDCLLKAARVYMVFEILEKLGEVIKSSPTVTDLEEESFDTFFTVLLVSESSQDHIHNRIVEVSEIERAVVTPFSIDEYTPQQDVDSLSTNEEEPRKDSNELSNSDSQPSNKKTPMKKTIRVDIDRLDHLMNLFEELVIDRGRLEQISQKMKNPELDETVEHMTRISGDMQDLILSMRMVPVDQVFNRFPRMIRQLARDLGKQIDVDIVGAETELDRTVIDKIGDPLVHLIRNAVDHGIETVNERKALGKSEQGKIELKAYHSGNHIFIEISDDGAGIDRKKVLEKALRNKVISHEKADVLTDQQVYELIMASGFSTADTVTDISGRGVGLDVVKNTIESLGGRITIDATFEKGSTFSIELPLTLSIMSVLLVKIGNEIFAIPLSSIMEISMLHTGDLMHAHNKKVFDFRGQTVPLAFLNELFESGPMPQEPNDSKIPVVVVRKGEKLTGLIVDELIGQQEVVLKSLGQYLTGTFAISGATILGDGRVALIIDSNALVL